MFGIVAFAAGFGPWLGGTIYDHFHSHMPFFAFGEVAIVTICALLLPLGPYAYAAPEARRRLIPAQAALLSIRSRLSRSLASSTWRENTYSAGRW